MSSFVPDFSRLVLDNRRLASADFQQKAWLSLIDLNRNQLFEPLSSTYTCLLGCEGLPCTDVGVEEGRPFQVGNITLQPLHTPGHTDGHFAYLLGDRVLTGDALLIEGCGRTDFQNGNADTLYRSVREKLFSLPDDVLVYPGARL